MRSFVCSDLERQAISWDRKKSTGISNRNSILVFRRKLTRVRNRLFQQFRHRTRLSFSGAN
jgi:hypothetical protein